MPITEQQMYFTIKYDESTEKFRIYPTETTPVESLDGMKEHIDRGYSSKALMDVIRRASGFPPTISRDNHEHITRLAYKGNTFVVDKTATECGKTFLDIAVEQELKRARRKEEFQKRNHRK